MTCSGSIRIETKNYIVYDTEINTLNELKTFLDDYAYSSHQFSIIHAAFVAPRTPSQLKTWSKDLFLPTFVNQALKIEPFALKIILSIGAILFDLATLIPRLILTSIRTIVNYSNSEKHPLKNIIKVHDKDTANDLDEGFVNIIYKLDVPQEDKSLLSYKGKMKIAIRQVPTFKDKTVHRVVQKITQPDGKVTKRLIGFYNTFTPISLAHTASAT